MPRSYRARSSRETSAISLKWSSSHHRLAREAPWTFHTGYGALSLDFANTVSWRGSGAPVDHLPTYGELIRFAQQSRLLSEDTARRLQRRRG